MKYLLALYLLVFTGYNSIGQASPGNSSPNLLEAALVRQPALQLAAQQARNWQLEKQSRPTDGAAWLNYFIWTERDPSLDAVTKQFNLGQAIREAGHFIPNSWQFHLMTYLQSGRQDSLALYQAVALSNEKTLVYPYLIQYLVKTGNKQQLVFYAREYNQLNPSSKALYEYHYNTLASANPGAVIYTKGLNDLVPMAVLQQVFNVRPDIQLKIYDGIVPYTPNSYLCLSLGKELLAKYPAASYTGLLVKLEPGTTIRELADHVDNDFLVDQIRHAVILTGEEASLYRNYLPGFILLYKHYRSTANPRAAALKEMVSIIAGMAGLEGNIKSIVE